MIVIFSSLVVGDREQALATKELSKIKTSLKMQLKMVCLG